MFLVNALPHLSRLREVPVIEGVGPRVALLAAMVTMVMVIERDVLALDLGTPGHRPGLCSQDDKEQLRGCDAS
eukprot:13928497-Heterocapsa_arctica.AAC.1